MATAKRSAAKTLTKAPAKRRKAAPSKAVDHGAALPRTAPAPSRSADWVPAPAPSRSAHWVPAPAPHVPMRPVQGLRRALGPLLAAYVALQATNLVLLFTIDDWGSFTAPFTAVDWGYLAFGLLGFAVYVPTIVVFCMWLHRVCSNAKDRGSLLDVSPGWAIGSFFIPFVQLVAPYFAIRKAYVSDVSPDTGPLLAWFLPWSLVNAFGYVMGVVMMVILFGMLADADLRDTEGAEEFNDDVREMTGNITRWTGPVSLALTATAGWFLMRLSRSWSDLQEPPAS